MRTFVAYPTRPVSGAVLGYNMGNVDSAHVDLATAGGASILRAQFAWSVVEDYHTGALNLPAAHQKFLSYCAAKTVKPMVVAAYGPPYTTIGTLTTTADTPAGTPAGTAISVQPYSFTIDHPSCYAGSVNGDATQYTNRASYYGSLIASADPGSITFGAATRVGIPQGATISVQRLRYPPVATDTDPSNAAYVRYATFLAAQIAAAGAQGYVNIWNEHPWPHDRWDALSAFYDMPPTGTSPTGRMKAVLALCQAVTLPAGVVFTNGMSDKTGFSGLLNQGIPVPGAITYDGLHPYGSNPETFAWDFYATDPTYGTGWWETVNTLDQTSNFRQMARRDDTTANAPGLMASECGIAESSDDRQARYLTRRVASLWGMKAIPVVYDLDGGGLFDVAPALTPRQSYTALQRMMAVLGHMTGGDYPATAPTIASWGSPVWPLMSCTFHAAQGHSSTFLWQRTYQTTNVYSDWANLPAPAAFPASLSLPGGVAVAECFNVRTGANVDTDVLAGYGGNILTVPVTDDVVALRLAPT